MTTERSPHQGAAANLRMAAATVTAPSAMLVPPGQGSRGGLAQAVSLRRGAQLLSQGLLGVLTGVLLVVGATAVPVLFGYHSYVIYGGSMGVGLPRGSVAVTHQVEAKSLKVGDIVAVKRPEAGQAVLHRIISIETQGGHPVAIIQGDRNATPDPEPVIFTGRGERVVYSIPFVGYILHYTGHGLGRVVLIAVPLVSLAVIGVHGRWRAWRQERGAEIGAASAERPTVPAVRVVTSMDPHAARSDLPAFLVEKLRRSRGDYLPLLAPMQKLRWYRGDYLPRLAPIGLLPLPAEQRPSTRDRQQAERLAA